MSIHYGEKQLSNEETQAIVDKQLQADERRAVYMKKRNEKVQKLVQFHAIYSGKCKELDEFMNE